MFIGSLLKVIFYPDVCGSLVFMDIWVFIVSNNCIVLISICCTCIDFRDGVKYYTSWADTEKQIF